MNSSVALKTVSLGALFGLKGNNTEIINTIDCEYELSIPDYQRIYCWEDKNVLKLLDDIKDFSNKKYHLGSVIFHKKGNGQHDIVDGQQRLVTLSLLLLQIQNEIDFSLSNANFTSNEANDYIAYNKWLIQNYYAIDDLGNNVQKILDNLQFSVLIIEDTSTRPAGLGAGSPPFVA